MRGKRHSGCLFGPCLTSARRTRPFQCKTRTAGPCLDLTTHRHPMTQPPSPSTPPAQPAVAGPRVGQPAPPTCLGRQPLPPSEDEFSSYVFPLIYFNPRNLFFFFREFPMPNHPLPWRPPTHCSLISSFLNPFPSPQSHFPCPTPTQPN